ncbi:MAG: hypothetical protein L0Y66_07105 [Myxococcaceae bacterium]|nr:hypothetical protein [Myxococcaceae bacterium]MCI0669742.1 hypothetical protein [Myxococcaceae bacterium]
MRTGTPFTVCLALLALGGAGASEWRAREHLKQAEWQHLRAAAHAETYVQTFDGTAVESELAAFGQRRHALALAERWEQGRAVALIATGLLLVAAYVSWFLGRLEACRLDVIPAMDAPPSGRTSRR